MTWNITISWLTVARFFWWVTLTEDKSFSAWTPTAGRCALGCPLNTLLVSDFHLPSALSLRGRLGLSLLVTHPRCLWVFSISRWQKVLYVLPLSQLFGYQPPLYYWSYCRHHLQSLAISHELCFPGAPACFCLTGLLASGTLTSWVCRLHSSVSLHPCAACSGC